MAVPETDRLLIQAGIPDNSGRDLRIVRIDNTDAVFSDILTADMKGIAVGDRLNHLWIQQTQPFGAAGDFVPHLHRKRLLHEDSGLSLPSRLEPVKKLKILR